MLLVSPLRQETCEKHTTKERASVGTAREIAIRAGIAAEFRIREVADAGRLGAAVLHALGALDCLVARSRKKVHGNCESMLWTVQVLLGHDLLGFLEVLRGDPKTLQCLEIN